MIDQNEDQPQLDLNSPSKSAETEPPLGRTVSTGIYCLKDETIYRLVDHSVGAIVLECGYHISHQSSLDILTEICCDYIKKIGRLLRIASDTRELRDQDSDFVDTLERVFHQINIPSAANLHQFVCKMQAIKRHRPNTTMASSQISQPQPQTQT